jgi:hypothetical protein
MKRTDVGIGPLSGGESVADDDGGDKTSVAGTEANFAPQS